MPSDAKHPTMARPGGRLHLLTIVAIFVVVFVSMWSAVQYSRGELVPEQDIDDDEQRLRAALWDAVESWRAQRGVGAPTRVQRVSTAAQQTAHVFANGTLSPGTTNATDRGQAGPQPSTREQCSQVLVRANVTLPSASADDGAFDATARTVRTALVETDDSGMLLREGPFLHGIGVVVEEGEAFVVYRSCSRRRLSP